MTKQAVEQSSLSVLRVEGVEYCRGVQSGGRAGESLVLLGDRSRRGTFTGMVVAARDPLQKIEQLPHRTRRPLEAERLLVESSLSAECSSTDLQLEQLLHLLQLQLLLLLLLHLLLLRLHWSLLFAAAVAVWDASDSELASHEGHTEEEALLHEVLHRRLKQSGRLLHRLRLFFR